MSAKEEITQLLDELKQLNMEKLDILEERRRKKEANNAKLQSIKDEGQKLHVQLSALEDDLLSFAPVFEAYSGDWELWLQEFLPGIFTNKSIADEGGKVYRFVQIRGVAALAYIIEGKSSPSSSSLRTNTTAADPDIVTIAVTLADKNNNNMDNNDGNDSNRRLQHMVDHYNKYNQHEPCIGGALLLPDLTDGNPLQKHHDMYYTPESNIVICKPSHIVEAMYYICRRAPSTMKKILSPEYTDNACDEFLQKYDNLKKLSEFEWWRWWWCYDTLYHMCLL